MDDWLSKRADALAAETGLPRASLDLDDESVQTLLDLARIAAHESGDRRNAPLLCYLVGVAQSGGRTVAELAEAVRTSTS